MAVCKQPSLVAGMPGQLPASRLPALAPTCHPLHLPPHLPRCHACLLQLTGAAVIAIQCVQGAAGQRADVCQREAGSSAALQQRGGHLQHAQALGAQVRQLLQAARSMVSASSALQCAQSFLCHEAHHITLLHCCCQYSYPWMQVQLQTATKSLRVRVSIRTIAVRQMCSYHSWQDTTEAGHHWNCCSPFAAVQCQLPHPAVQCTPARRHQRAGRPEASAATQSKAPPAPQAGRSRGRWE